MELLPGKGIGQLVFGMHVDTCLEILGEPDRSFQIEDEEEETHYEFNEPKVRITVFEDEGERLGYIRTANPDLKYKGQRIINMPIDDVIDEVFADLNDDWAVDEEDYFSSYVNESLWLTLNVEYGVVTDIELGVPTNDEEAFEWPNA